MKKSYRYAESGLTNVWLLNGYTIRKTRYGQGVSIHDMEGLHRALVRALANKPRLTGAEVRFLRKEMGLSRRGLGELLGVSDQAVALWERKGRLPKRADDCLLRLIYAEHDKGSAPSADFIRDLNDPNHQQILAEATKSGWQAHLAA